MPFLDRKGPFRIGDTRPTPMTCYRSPIEVVEAPRGGGFLLPLSVILAPLDAACDVLLPVGRVVRPATLENYRWILCVLLPL